MSKTSGALLGGLSRVRSAAAPTARAEFEQLLRSKSAWLQDVSKHPLCAGVPLGRQGGAEGSISVDLGLKNFSQISTRELAASSSEYRRQLIERTKGGALEGQPEDLRRAETIPMAVIIKEDVQRLPIATPARSALPYARRPPTLSSPSAANPRPLSLVQMHKASLDRNIRQEDMQILQDPFFNAGPASPELAKLVIDAIPDSDPNQTAVKEYRRELRAAQFPDQKPRT